MLKKEPFKQRHPLIFTVIFCFVFVVVLNVIFVVMEIYLNIKVMKKTTDFFTLLSHCLYFLIFILTIVFFKCSKILKADFKSFKESFKGTYFLFILAFIVPILRIIETIQKKEEFASFFKIMLGLLDIFKYAFREEIIFRGILANLLAFKHAQTKKGTYKAIFLSSFCFAAMHFVNVTTGAKILAVSFQALNAFFLGALITIVYFKFNFNIFVVSLWHTILNCDGLFEVYFLKKSISFKDTFNDENVVESSVILIIILILICLFYLRKNAVEKIIENVNSFKKKFYDV